MRAIVCDELGPLETLRLAEVPDPEAGPGQVLIDVAAAGVNYVDALFVQGRYQIKPPVPFTPGSEIAGTVAAAGAGVQGLEPGTRVLASCGLGGFAERAAVPAASAVAIPDRLDAPRAATFTQSFSTMLYALRDRGAVRPDEKVLVLGGGGGIGLAAIALAKVFGARVAAVASSAAKRDLARRAGADEVIDPGSADVKAAAREWSGGGVDVVVDPVGGDLAEPALRALGEGGRYLVIGFAAGAIPRLPLNQVLLRNRTIVGVDWGAWAGREPHAQRLLLADLLALAADGRVDPPEPTAYPLDAAVSALRDLYERRAAGKIALTM
ncbi:MAG TPA: zinc-binding dehydrogenase [Streptosporangiaceae bacterium]|jgi:NADPH2:quinone reductase